jgi:hypothetical protein
VAPLVAKLDFVNQEWQLNSAAAAKACGLPFFKQVWIMLPSFNG